MPQYLIDPTQTHNTTTITAQDGDQVQFADTIIYPGGGGQPRDRATVNAIAVRDATPDGWYTLAKPLPVGTKVVQAIDWPFRHQTMRYHTLLHLIAGLAATTGAKVTSNQILTDHARIELVWPDADQATVFDDGQLHSRLQKVIAQHLPVTARLVARNALGDESAHVRTLVSLIPPTVTQVRLVKIGDFDEEACAGTHVANTKDLPDFTIETHRKGACKRRLKITLATP